MDDSPQSKKVKRSEQQRKRKSIPENMSDNQEPEMSDQRREDGANQQCESIPENMSDNQEPEMSDQRREDGANQQCESIPENMSDNQEPEMSDQRREDGANQQCERKRDILSWDEYFMGIAFLSARRSKFEKRKVGACIVNSENRIVATGYNGYIDPPRQQGNQDNDAVFTEEEKRDSVCHAEMNAVINRHGTSLNGCTVYVTFFPCNECAKLLAQSRISKVIYYANDKFDHEKYKLSRKMMEFAKIELRSYIEGQNRKEICLHFDEMAFQNV